MFVKILCIFIGIVIVLFFNKHFIEAKHTTTKDLVLFKDNGNRIKIKPKTNPAAAAAAAAGTTAAETIECNLKTLVRCKLISDFDCFECKETLSSCVHFEQDETIYDHDNNTTVIGTIKANANASEGYCLRLEGKNKRTCTFKNGGRWILVERDNKYTYVCACLNPDTFSRTTLHGDCTHFNKCRNGKISNNKWEIINEIQCDCNDNYIKDNKSQCLKKNLFQHTTSPLPFKKLDRKYIDDRYSGRDLNLPNPCTFNPATKTEYGPDIADIKILNDIAFCVAISPRYVTILFEDDYLRNNGGKYANGVVPISSADPENGIIYETHTRHRKSKKLYDNIFTGRRYNFKHIDLYLPFLDLNSQNLGGPGQRYIHAAFMTPDQRENSLVNVWEAPVPVPVPPQPPKFGNIITYVPTYASRFDASYRAFYGIIPSVSVPLLSCSNYHIISLSKGFRKYPYLDNPIVESEFNPIDQKPPRTDEYTMPMLCKDNKNQTIVQVYSNIFTGLITSYTYGEKFFTKPLSPGRDFVNKYRLNLDPDWVQFKSSNIGMYVNEPFALASDRFEHTQFGETAYSIDCGENYSMPNKNIARYKCNDLNDYGWIEQF